MDKIHLNDIVCRARLGVLPGERDQAQKIRIDLTLTLDLDPAARSDALSKTVDYVQLVDRVRHTVEESPCRLLETVAHRVCRTLLLEGPIARVQVTVRKFPALLAGRISSVAVEMTRTREEVQRHSGDPPGSGSA